MAGQDKVYLLRFYARKGEAQNFIPPFIEVIKDVYSDKEYKLETIARKKNIESAPQWFLTSISANVRITLSLQRSVAE